ncbi:MAG TPA: hypothetical protein PK325_12445 [Cyclobacteriaceae bacterium]|nr:hypothetical protein [Cyclobacteriaceae bacterium]HMV07944.1 hypothetical protein [Cyclobacteriaceae bacterium]HMV88212.1 hypothetical protein [Cyclobacteriaceae bacterium]HMW99078.1 hypothetical protein [Cyclobacteriaceae bacterium]HMX48289.1 hypothetical protein [Cyclobacteriaceae bacterium]
MRLLVMCVLACTLVSCKDNFDIEEYYSTPERDSLVTDIITYIHNRPQYSNSQTRFESRFRSYYAGQLKEMRVEKFFVATDGTHYFYIIRPSNNTPLGLRGTGGMFKRDTNGKIISFKEVFVTPGASLADLQTRGDELFREMVRYGNVDAYQKNPDYIEWPAKWNYYDTLQHEWLSKPGI